MEGDEAIAARLVVSKHHVVAGIHANCRVVHVFSRYRVEEVLLDDDNREASGLDLPDASCSDSFTVEHGANRGCHPQAAIAPHRGVHPRPTGFDAYGCLRLAGIRRSSARTADEELAARQPRSALRSQNDAPNVQNASVRKARVHDESGGTVAECLCRMQVKHRARTRVQRAEVVVRTVRAHKHRFFSKHANTGTLKIQSIGIEKVPGEINGKIIRPQRREVHEIPFPASVHVERVVLPIACRSIAVRDG